MTTTGDHPHRCYHGMCHKILGVLVVPQQNAFLEDQKTYSDVQIEWTEAEVSSNIDLDLSFA